MISLLTCDYHELLDQQPVSRSGLAALQNGAVSHDPVCAVWFRKHMISLTAHLALQAIEKHHLDRDHLLAHIDADELENIGFNKSFSEWGNEDVHIQVVNQYIQDVIDSLYVNTHDGEYIEKEAYQRAANAFAQWTNARQAAPSAAELAQAANVAVEVAEAAGKNEAWKKEQAELEQIEKQRFHRLKEIIRDSDMPFSTKLNFLETLHEIPQKMRPFFFAYYGVDDGIPKPIEEIAGQFMMTPKEAQLYLQDMLDKRHTHYVSCVRQDPYYDLMVSLREFLLENEKNREAYQAYEAQPRRRSKKLSDYID